MQNRKILVALLVMFSLPMLFAGIFYYRGKPIGNTTNHGILITPPIQSKKLFDQPPKKWTIVWYNPQHCEQRQCLDLLHDLSQIIKATGKYQNNAQVAVLTLEKNKTDSVLNKILKANPKLNARTTTMNLYQRTLKQNPAIGKIYLMDPRGFIMMSYPQNVDPMKIYKDLSRLLKYTG